MNDPNSQKPVKAGSESAEKDGPPMWLQASQWGMALVAYTCLLGFGGYFIGEKFLGGSFWSIALLLIGLVGGMTIGIWQIFRASEKMDKAMQNKGKPLPDKSFEENKD